MEIPTLNTILKKITSKNECYADAPTDNKTFHNVQNQINFRTTSLSPLNTQDLTTFVKAGLIMGPIDGFFAASIKHGEAPKLRSLLTLGINPGAAAIGTNYVATRRAYDYLSEKDFHGPQLYAAAGTINHFISIFSDRVVATFSGQRIPLAALPYQLRACSAFLARDIGAFLSIGLNKYWNIEPRIKTVAVPVIGSIVTTIPHTIGMQCLAGKTLSDLYPFFKNKPILVSQILSARLLRQLVLNNIIHK
ncbi:hypothetical protein DID76_04365 [Candidatus Marinamargulisbacteria bacterium SCGC AG-414-C22]|nr:hypothetical protein DID76_04365 [Candidatus Marinamargulisbacteria bacterium SCGC AG-414-C22]